MATIVHARPTPPRVQAGPAARLPAQRTGGGVRRGRITAEVSRAEGDASHRWLRLANRWASQVADPRRLLASIGGFGQYVRDWRRYSRLPGAEPIRFIDTHPQVSDRTASTTIDAHYFYMNGWSMRRILANSPALHVDVGSQALFVNLLAACLPVVFLDYRPLEVDVPGLKPLAGDIRHLPFPDGALPSLSCLHVAEHVGLGRYGDPLDPRGTERAAQELARVLAKDGSLFFALPVGRPRLCFNAHRIHDPASIPALFGGLDLIEFSHVTDKGNFREHSDLSGAANEEYACGMFWFRKPA